VKTCIKQLDISDCGPACLASIAAYYKLRIPVSRIRQYAATEKSGTNVLGMLDAAERLGFQAKAVRGKVDSITKVPKPAIAHVIGTGGLHHFVVIYKTGKKFITVMDPGEGRMQKKLWKEFEKGWTGVLILFSPADEFTSGDERISILKRFLFLIKPHHAILLQAITGAIIYSILGLSVSVYVQKIIDHVLINGNINLLNLLSVGMIILLLLQLCVNYFKSVFMLKTGQHIDARLILGYYKHLLKLPQRFFDTMRTGEIISRINDAVKIRTFINDVSVSFIVNFFIIFFSFILMFSFYWKLAVILLAVIPFYFLLYIVTNQLNKRMARRMMEKSAALETQVVESIQAVSTIKRFGLEHFSNDKTERKFIQLLEAVFTAGTNAISLGNISELISRLFTIVILWAGSYYVIQRQLTTGELLSFYTLIGYFTGPASTLIGMNRNMQDALVAADRLFEIMDLEREESLNKMELSRCMISDIRFKNVSFRYGSGPVVFQNIDLVLPAGKITAFVGESGSGKSTLMSLLQNIYQPVEGNIYIGDYELMHISNESLRSIIAVVPQQVDLFAGNFIENIAIGDYDPDLRKIIRVCNAVDILRFIESLPAGLHSSLGENAVNLSGGQRQRIAIARALYRDPEVLILDEATSSLDTVSEQYVQAIIQALRQQGKTVLIIAHRLSTIRNADQIIVMEKGKIVEAGTHDVLLKNAGRYEQFWLRQTT